jgi:hypothetical protein
VATSKENDPSGFKVAIFIEEVLPLGLFGPWDDFLGLVIVLLNEKEITCVNYQF